MAVGHSAISLKMKDFPSEFRNVYCPRKPSLKQFRRGSRDTREKVFADPDRRKPIYPTIDEPDGETLLAAAGYDYHSCGYPGVGLLRIEFDENDHYIGTATMIADGPCCLLTCAHNVVEYKKNVGVEPNYAVNLWFELRKNTASGSDMIAEYKVSKMIVHPKYFENPTPESGFDLALCWIDIPENDKFFSELNIASIPIATAGVGNFTTKSRIALVGFPGEDKEGEKWGMIVDVPTDKVKDWVFSGDKYIELLVYDFIDTSPGQSGSAVIHITGQNFESVYEIIGVHTGGSDIFKKNWATSITPAKFQWISQCLEEDKNLRDER